MWFFYSRTLQDSEIDFHSCDSCSSLLTWLIMEKDFKDKNDNNLVRTYQGQITRRQWVVLSVLSYYSFILHCMIVVVNAILNHIDYTWTYFCQWTTILWYSDKSILININLLCLLACWHHSGHYNVLFDCYLVFHCSANASVGSRDQTCDTCTETDSVLSSRRGESLNTLPPVYV